MFRSSEAHQAGGEIGDLECGNRAGADVGARGRGCRVDTFAVLGEIEQG